jgi:hypothetical protein
MHIKNTILAFIALTGLGTMPVLGHGGVELGPNGGRILEFSKDETMHGEVSRKDGKFHVALFDKNMKPVKVNEQTLTATGGTREKPEKLTVEKSDSGFVVPLVKEGQWLILQFKEKPASKAVTARFEYDTGTCSKCKAEEWVCKCDQEKKK